MISKMLCGAALCVSVLFPATTGAGEAAQSVKEATTMLDDVEVAVRARLPYAGDPRIEAELLLPEVQVEAVPVAPDPVDGPSSGCVSLNGAWRMQQATPGGGLNAGFQLPECDRSAWIGAHVPGTVQRNLVDSGVLGDPFFSRNWVDRAGFYGADFHYVAMPEEKQEWWFVRTFDTPPDTPGGWRLVFDGVDYDASFYLNGHWIGAHRGMYGGPEFEVSTLLRKDGPNTLAVAIAPPPRNKEGTFKEAWFGVFKPNVVFGWHYGHMVTMGLWRSVALEPVSSIEARDPQVRVKNLGGALEVAITIDSRHSAPVETALRLSIRPDNFDGPSQTWQVRAILNPGTNRLRVPLAIANPRVWWPAGYGDQPLYRFQATLDGATSTERGCSTVFGIRTLRMEAAPNATPDQYRWQFVINDRPMFIKGANWCWFDPYLEQPRSKYEHILELTRRAHIQMLRVWGGGPIECDAFYDICNRKGILVWQEFPFCTLVPDIPATDGPLVDDQATRVVRRLRNHPSLVAWAGGNEVSFGRLGSTLALLGKRVHQLDPSRPFHSGSPSGGDVHNWGVYHGDQPITAYAATKTPFLTEFGVPSPTNAETMPRYLAQEDYNHWPPADLDTAMISHSAQFSLSDWARILYYGGDYGPVASWRDYILYGQMGQGDAIRYGSEFMRTQAHRGGCGFFFYKLTDIFPGQSWAVIDFYGVPKLSYYRVGQFCQPLTVFAHPDKFDWQPNETFRATLHVANDTPNALRSARVVSTLYKGDGASFWERTDEIQAEPDTLQDLPSVEIPVPSDARPMLLATTLHGADGAQVAESWYWFNYADLNDAVRQAREIPSAKLYNEKLPGVFGAYASLPPSRLRTRFARAHVTISDWKPTAPSAWTTTITNTAKVPAFMVTAEGLPPEYGYYLSDNGFCLRPGASSTLRVDAPAGKPLPALTFSVWNGDVQLEAQDSSPTP